MHRTQLYLDDFQYRDLRELARRQGKSLAQVVREILEVYLAESRSRKDPFLQVIGKVTAGRGNVSGDYKEHLYGRKPRDRA